MTYYSESANPFYDSRLPLGYVDDEPIYEGDTSWLCCLIEDYPEPNYNELPF